MNETRKMLESVAAGELSVDEAVMKLKSKPFDDIGYAKVDLQRGVRQGAEEVIYGEGKTAEQIIGIVNSMKENGQKRILITRLSPDKAERISATHHIAYYPEAGIAAIDESEGGMQNAATCDGIGRILVVTGGTSDIPVAEEAALTAEFLGNKVDRLYDVGVSGIHRLLASKELIMDATVIVVVAGMEGALASVVGGLADCPVIAVPTSIGYGAAFGGLAALLSMLNSCASGVSVVNIDNGFGAGYMASMINHVGK